MAWVNAPTVFNRRKVLATIDGPEKTGKTTLALTGRGPVAVINMNDGLAGVIEKRAAENPIGFFQIADHPLPDEVGREQAKAKAVIAWAAVRKDFEDALKAKRGTVVIDTGTELDRLCRMSEFGGMKSDSRKGALDYDMRNSKMRGFVRLYHAYPSNVIITHQLEEEWVQKVVNGETKNQKSGRLLRDGFKEIPNMVELGLTTYKRLDPEHGLIFGATLDICRFAPTWEGFQFEGEDCNLPHICALVTETEESEWR